MTRLDKKERISNAIDPTSLSLPFKFTDLIAQCNDFRKAEFQHLSTFNYKQLNYVINISFDQIEKDCTSKDTNTIIHSCYIVECLRRLCPERIPDLINCTSKFIIRDNNIDVGILISYVTSKLYNQVDDSESFNNKLYSLENDFDSSYQQIPIMYFLLYLIENSPKAVLLNIQRNSFMNIIKKAAYSNKEDIRSIAADTLRKYIDLIKDKPEVNLYDFVMNVLSSMSDMKNNIGTLLILSVFFEKKLFHYFPNANTIFEYIKKIPTLNDDETKAYKIYCELLTAPLNPDLFQKEIPIIEDFFMRNNFNSINRVLKVYSSAFLLFAQNCMNLNINWASKIKYLILIESPCESAFIALEILFEHSKISFPLVSSIFHSTKLTMEFATYAPRVISKFTDSQWCQFRDKFFLKIMDDIKKKPFVAQLLLISSCRPFKEGGNVTPESNQIHIEIHKVLLNLLKNDDSNIRANLPAALLQNAKGTDKLPEIVEKLLIQVLSEKESFVRMKTLLSFPESTAILMSSQTALNCFDTLVNDECYKVRMAVVTLLGRIVKISPFSVLPLMRRFLLDDLFLLNSQRSHRLQKEMAKLLLPLIQVAVGILPVYASTICQIALEHFSTPPKREQTILERESFFNISTSMSKIVNVIAKKDINLVSPYFDQFIDTFMMILKQHNKKELKIAVIEALTTFVSNCGNKFHFDRKLMFSELTSIASKWNSKKLNLAFLKLFGLLGAVDVNMIQDQNENIDIEEIDIDHHKYCLNVVCKTLFGILQDNSLNIHHSEATIRLVDIFILHEESSFDWYVKFMPLFLNEIRTTRSSEFLKLLQNLCTKVPPTWLTCFTDDLISLVYELWGTDQLLDVLGVVSALAAALNNQFAPFLPQCITLLLDCLFSSRSSRADISLKVMESILALRHVSYDYLFLIVPEIITTASRSMTPEETRVDALDSLRIIIQSCDCSNYTASIVRCIKSCIQTQGKMREMALQVLYSLQVSLGKKFALYQDIFNRILDRDDNFKQLSSLNSVGKFSNFDFINTSEKLRSLSFTSTPLPTDSQIQSLQQSIQQQKQQQLLYIQLKKNLKILSDYLKTQTPWGMKEFFKKFVETLIKYSPENCISISSTLASNLSNISESLFNVAFLSCWEVFNDEDRTILKNLLFDSFQSRFLSDNARSLIVNLIEFMDRAERSIGIDPETLCIKCIEYGNNARAFYFAQRWFQKKDDNESSKKMIEIASTLGLHQLVIGLATVLLKGCSTLPSSLEQLGEWDKALDHYNEALKSSSFKFDEINISGKLRCMKHLMMWDEMIKFIPLFNNHYNKTLKTTNNNKSRSYECLSEKCEIDGEITRENEIAASLIESCHNLQRYLEILDLLHHCNKNDVSSFVFAAIAQFKNGQKDKAEKTINKAFDTLAQRARTMFKHDKSMLYQTVLESMKLTELSEIMNNKVDPSLWNERLILCRKNFDVAFSIMSVRFCYQKSFQQSILLLKRALKTHNWTLFKQVEKQFFTEKQRKESFEIIRIDAMSKWEQGMLNEALEQIMSIDIESKSIENEDFSNNDKKLHSKISFLRGQWILRMTPPNEVNKVIEKVMPHIEMATKLDAQNYKAWHRWSWVCANIFHADNNKTSAAIDAIKGFMECVKLRAVNSFSDLLQMVSIFFMANLDDESFQSVSTLISSLDDAFILRISQQLFAQLKSEKGRISRFVIELIRSRLPRLFHVLLYPIILLRNGDEKTTRHRIRSRSISNVATNKMPKLLPNSISLSSGMNHAPRQSPLSNALSRITHKNLNQNDNSNNFNDFAFNEIDFSMSFSERVAEELIQNFEIANPTAVHEAEIISTGLLRASYLKIEKVINLLTKLFKLFKKKDFKKMLEITEFEFNEPVNNNNDENFMRLHSAELIRLANILQCMNHPTAAAIQKNQKDLHQLMVTLYKDLTDELSEIRSIKLSDISIELAEMKDSVLSVPGTYAAHYVTRSNQENDDNTTTVTTVTTNSTTNITSFLNIEASNAATNNNTNNQNDPDNNNNINSSTVTNGYGENDLITIASFHPALEMIKSKQYPRLVVINGSDGCQHTSLLKGQEDLRLDQNVMQFFELINMHIENSFTPESRHLRVHTYSITPLSSMSGLIQFIDNTDTLYRLISGYRQQRGIKLKLEETIGSDGYNNIEFLTPIQRLEFLQQVNSNKENDEKLKGNDLREVIWLKSGNAYNWILRTIRFAQTSAIVSIVGYILGLGDRHPSNIMMHRLSGDVIHIDLGDCFEVGKKRSKFPEKVPFRLTRMIRNAFGPSGIEGEFRLTCEQTMKLVRGHRESIMTVLNIFLQDPLEGTIKTQTVSSTASSSVLISLNANIKQTNNNNNNDDANIDDESKSDHINVANGNDDDDENGVKLNITEALERITSKIIGKDFDNETELEIKDQVGKLIISAQDEYNLAHMYPGWLPFW